MLYKDCSEKMRSLKDEVRLVKNITKINLKNLIDQINIIKTTNTVPENEIEDTLTHLLRCIQLGYGKKEFLDLNNFYSKINKKNSDEYLEIYDIAIKD